jgi:hypothetical protein
MATYRAKSRANTWRKFVEGMLSYQEAAIQEGVRVVGAVVGEQEGTGDDVLGLANGMFTKAKWFDVVGQVPPSEEPPTPTEKRIVKAVVYLDDGGTEELFPK